MVCAAKSNFSSKYEFQAITFMKGKNSESNYRVSFHLNSYT